MKTADVVVDDLEKAFSNMQFADIQLLCNGEKFDCHKVILALKSPVFNTMFSNVEMKENINKEVNLDSMSSKVLKVLKDSTLNGSLIPQTGRELERIIINLIPCLSNLH